MQPHGRFGSLAFERGRVLSFEEKPPGGEGWINGGFFVPEPKVLRTIAGDKDVWERDCLLRSPPVSNSMRFSITASGSPWTRCATRNGSNASGKPEQPP